MVVEDAKRERIPILLLSLSGKKKSKVGKKNHLQTHGPLRELSDLEKKNQSVPFLPFLDQQDRQEQDNAQDI